MSEEICYCDVCSRLIPPGDVRTGKAALTSDGAVCAACAASLPGRQHAAPRDTNEGGTSKSSRRRPARWGAKGPSVAVLFGSSFGVGILVVAAVVVLVLPSDSGAPAPLPEPFAPAPAPVVVPIPGPSPPVTAAPEPVPAPLPHTAPPRAEPEDDGSETAPASAGERLAAIREMDGPSLGRYGAMREALAAFAHEFTGAPEADEAAAFLAEIDARYAAEAEQALADAKAAAAELAAAGRFDDAARMLTTLRPRYSEGKWLDEQGEPAIAEALAEVAAARDRAAAARKEEAAAREEVAARRGERTGGKTVVYDDALPADWQLTAWGGCRLGEADGGANGSRKSIRIGVDGSAQGWCGGHVTTRGVSVAGQNALPLSPEACANGFLVFLVNGSSDASGRHVGGQSFQANVSRRTGGGGTWDGGCSVQAAQYTDGGAVDSDPASWQRVRIPLSAILKDKLLDTVGDVAFQYIGDAPAAGVLVDMIAIEE